MNAHKVTFKNSNGLDLAARLEVPVNEHPHTYAIFAHCFTCNKNLTAVRNISRALTLEGIAVLRFDFTGLGQSEGAFSSTNFSSNISDLLKAAAFLEEHYKAAAILIGHSLGGAAAIRAAAYIDSIEAVATIGAPYEPEHVEHLLEGGMAELEARGEASIHIGGRPFTIQKQFIDDLRKSRCVDLIKNLNSALLIFHSPQDQVVAIENAAKLYRTAPHPKSFIAVDGADHMLSQKEDSLYVGKVISQWASRYIDIPEKKKLEVQKDVAVRLDDQGFTTEIMVRKHSLTSDEPTSIGGNDFGPSPYELLNASLGACTAMTLQMYARRKKWDLQEVIVHLEHRKDYAEDMSDMENPQSKIDHFVRLLELKGQLDPEQRQRLLEIAEKCPVHRTLHSPVKIETHLKD